ncbi:hypothetical protein FHG87_012716 [Trinorchestia longiramus]|nr:hypothetical protein FHG87_012716 [Trinorchestia longiramus]
MNKKILTLLLCVVGVTTAFRTAKMPDLAIEEVAQEYRKFTDRRVDDAVTPYSVTGSGFRLPDSVNHLKVKTNSSNPYKNEKNVTLNLNIPASVSGFLLEEIDLKYVKKSRKKSKSNQMSNLLIKYFTNRSSNLHLSSVTKQEDTKPEYYQYDDVKERRDTPENREGVEEQQSFERPFRYQHKYPLQLLEKIKSSTNKLRKLREGKHIDRRLQGGMDARLRRSSAEEKDEVDLTEEDLMALESILSSKTIVKSSEGPYEHARSIGNDGDALEEDPSMSELVRVFEQTMETTDSPLVVDEETENNDGGLEAAQVEDLTETESAIEPEPFEEKEHYEDEDSTNWFSKTLPEYFLSVLQPFRPGMFGGHNILARRKREANKDDSESEIQGRERYKKFKYSYVKNPRLKNRKRVVAPLFPSKTFDNRRHLGNKMIGTIKLINGKDHGTSSKVPKNKVSHPSIEDFPGLRSPISLHNSFLPLDSEPFSSSLTKDPLETGLQRVEVKRKLSKLEYYFSTLRVDDEVCRQMLLCEVASKPVEFSPLAEMFTQETRLAKDTGAVGARVGGAGGGPGGGAGGDVLGGQDGARLLSYHEAMERGARRSPHSCEAYTSRCRTSLYDIIDTASLKLWREISNWLTVRVLAGGGSLF